MPEDPPRSGNVIDFQTEALGRLRAQVTQLSSSNAQLLHHSREQQGIEQRLFTAVLAALDAEGLDHLIHVITADWVDMLGVDAVVLALESGGQRFTMTGTGIQRLAADGLEQLLPDAQLLSCAQVESGAEVFGPAAPLVRAQAFVRIGDAPAGVVALGSRDSEAFAGHGTRAALLFLGQIVNRCLIRWLDQTL